MMCLADRKAAGESPMSSVLVTGASGFIGSSVCECLTAAGWRVRAALRDIAREAALAAGCERTAVGEIGPQTSWGEALTGVDAVVHLAARVHVMHDTAGDPLTAYRLVNTAGTMNLARQAAAAGVRRFVYLSSIKVNGEATVPGRPFTEEDIPAPVDPYGVSKHEAEQGLLGLARETGLEVVIIRPPLVYGPGVKANFYSMMRWLHRGLPLPLGAIDNRRSLVALDNLVNLIVTCIDHPAAANQVFLAGDGEDLSTTGLLQRLAAAMGKPARLLPVPPFVLETGAALLGKRGLAQRLCGSLQVDIDKARRLLGWTPPISVDEALHRTAVHFLQALRDHRS
jgi:UDP-4-keto-D-QuiNAc 4-reductase